ncbi:MAG TPA: hypothetical protein DEQ38_09965 [Elusimicrobia bacterium]|nr:MAG: hypothetical protein A2089_10065 [Elusimicrobia bacterium GWD2_63_28]HCC48423.1 hypothetical protein [Elusimicrobiota bacterium]
MSALTDLFPEIYRYKAQDAGKVRLVSGAAAALAVCAAAGYSVAKTTASWPDYLTAVTGMQFNMLVFYGALCTAKSVTQEKAERTWDFQRLTPLSSFEIAAGKFLGAPVFAWFLFACMLPAALLTLPMSGETPGLFFSRYALGLSCALLAMAGGLLVSAYDDSGGSGMGHLAGPLVGLVGVGVLNAAFRYADSLGRPYEQLITFYGTRLGAAEGLIFLSGSFLAFAAWAFLGARYRIGRDLLERRRAWRLPAFLVFLAWYAAGWEHAGNSGEPPFAALLLPALGAYIAAFLSGERREYWRRWLRGGDPARRLDDTPEWIKGAAAVFFIGALLWLAYVVALPPGGKQYWRMYYILPLFLLRDLMFLQWCRFSGSRRPEMMALAYLALAYFLPLVVLAPTGMNDWLIFFVPYAREASGLAANAAGPLIQAVLMGVLLRLKIRSALGGGA